MNFYEEKIQTCIKELTKRDTAVKYALTDSMIEKIKHLSAICDMLFNNTIALADRPEKAECIETIDTLCKHFNSLRYISNIEGFSLIGYLMYLREYISMLLQNSGTTGEIASLYYAVSLQDDEVYNAVTVPIVIDIFTHFADDDFGIFDCNKELHSAAIRHAYSNVCICLQNDRFNVTENTRMLMHFAELLFKSSDLSKANKNYILQCHSLAMQTLNAKESDSTNSVIGDKVIKLFSFFAHGFFFDPELTAVLGKYSKSYSYCYDTLRDINKHSRSKANVDQVIDDITTARDVFAKKTSTIFDDEDIREIVHYHDLVLTVIKAA